jgi:hypothetical protein
LAGGNEIKSTADAVKGAHALLPCWMDALHRFHENLRLARSFAPRDAIGAVTDTKNEVVGAVKGGTRR